MSKRSGRSVATKRVARHVDRLDRLSAELLALSNESAGLSREQLETALAAVRQFGEHLDRISDALAERAANWTQSPVSRPGAPRSVRRPRLLRRR